MRKATHKGKLTIGTLEIPCFVLEDGTRVISGRGMTTAIGMQGRGQGVSRISQQSTLKPFISEDLRLAIEEPIHFIGFGGSHKKPSAGFEATVLLNICETVLEARDAGALKSEQEQRYAIQCDALMRAFAKVGIIALVDEATGYQEEREKDALHQLLSAFISEELMPWTKRFPDEFYKQLFRLQGWQFNPLSNKRPRLIGKLTKNIVYERISRDVLEELEKKNPPNASGNRRHKHHQFLTEDIGHPALDKHISGVIALMRASSNKAQFQRALQRAYPLPEEQLKLDAVWDENE